MAIPTRPVVLIVDDERDLRMMLSLVLNSRGFEVLTAADGVEALRELDGHTPIDVLILDERMPVMSGSELLVQLQAIPQRADLPVICISAFGADEHGQRMLDLGADAFLPKPFSIGELVATVERVLADSAMRREQFVDASS
jgi:DNA-binding response OmpR family regulator